VTTTLDENMHSVRVSVLVWINESRMISLTQESGTQKEVEQNGGKRASSVGAIANKKESTCWKEKKRRG